MTLFIPLDTPPKPPPWLPKTRLWYGLDKWGVDGAASVIEARVQAHGGEVREETLPERAARVAKEDAEEEERKQFLSSLLGVDAAAVTVRDLLDELGKQTNELETSTNWPLELKKAEGRAVLLARHYSLSLDWKLTYSNTLKDSRLVIGIWNDHPPWHEMRFLFEEPRRVQHEDFDFDREPSGKYVWKNKLSSKTYSNSRLIELGVTLLLDWIQAKNKRD